MVAVVRVAVKLKLVDQINSKRGFVFADLSAGVKVSAGVRG